MILKKQKDFLQYLKVLDPEIDQLINDASVIADIGCARGCFLKILNENYGIKKDKLYGFDISKKYLSVAQKTFKNCKVIDFSKKINFSNTFDLVFCFDVIEHIKNPYIFLRNINKILNNQGKLILSTPNINSLSAKNQGKNWFGFKDKDHYIFYTPKSILHLLKMAGFKTLKIKSASTTFSPLYNNVISFTKLGGEIIVIAEKK